MHRATKTRLEKLLRNYEAINNNRVNRFRAISTKFNAIALPAHRAAGAGGVVVDVPPAQILPQNNTTDSVNRWLLFGTCIAVLSVSAVIAYLILSSSDSTQETTTPPDLTPDPVALTHIACKNYIAPLLNNVQNLMMTTVKPYLATTCLVNTASWITNSALNLVPDQALFDAAIAHEAPLTYYLKTDAAAMKTRIGTVDGRTDLVSEVASVVRLKGYSNVLVQFNPDTYPDQVNYGLFLSELQDNLGDLNVEASQRGVSQYFHQGFSAKVDWGDISGLRDSTRNGINSFFLNPADGNDFQGLLFW